MASLVKPEGEPGILLNCGKLMEDRHANVRGNRLTNRHQIRGKAKKIL